MPVAEGARIPCAPLAWGGLAYLSWNRQFWTHDLPNSHTQMFQCFVRRQIKHLLKCFLVAIKYSRKQSLYPKNKALAPKPKFCDGTRSRCAQVEDGETVGWVETAAIDTSSLAAEWVIPLFGDVAISSSCVRGSGSGATEFNVKTHVRQ